MIEALILYGSKARQDHDRFSDTDLLGIINSDRILKPFEKLGVSLHLYPYNWLLEQSECGALFLLHLTTEAIPIFDPNNLLHNLRDKFHFKDSYEAEIESGCRIAYAVTRISMDSFNENIRKRYFWGVRTSLIAASAQEGLANFSAKKLEEFSKIDGLALHIQTRANASFAECQRFGALIIDYFKSKGAFEVPLLYDQNIEKLLKIDGVGKTTARELIYGLDSDQIG